MSKTTRTFLCSPVYRETTHQYIENILKDMTVQEKIGQLFLVFFEGPELSSQLKKMIHEYHIGGIILYSISHNIKDPIQVSDLIQQAQQESRKHGAGIPLFVAIDQEGGRVARLTNNVTTFPGNMAIGATGSEKDARLMAMITAKELKAIGINMNFAPVVDVNNNPDNPVIGTRSFGSSSELVAKFGEAMIEAYMIYGIIPTAKHFPGHGDTTIDSHIGIPVVTHGLQRLEAVELLPFQHAIDSGIPAIMTAHVVIPALENNQHMPATLSHSILSGLLRERMGFDGLIITDSLGMGAIDQTYGISHASLMALKAGADILLFGADKDHGMQDQIKVYDYIQSAVNSGKVSMQRLDESVRRILNTKVQYGLFDTIKNDPDNIPEKVGIEKYHVISQSIAKDSITLVKDEKGFLPIKTHEPLFVIWPEGKGNILDILKGYHTKIDFFPYHLEPSIQEIETAVKKSAHYSKILIGTYEVRKHLVQKGLIDSLALLEKDMIVVSLDTPYDLLCFPEIPCYLAIYGTSSVSLDAMANVLFGFEKPKGRLPVDLPGLYPFQHGMMDFKTESFSIKSQIKL